MFLNLEIINYQTIISNKIYFILVKIFTKSLRFVTPATKTITNEIKVATPLRHNKTSLYHILVKNINTHPGITIKSGFT